MSRPVSSIRVRGAISQETDAGIVLKDVETELEVPWESVGRVAYGEELLLDPHGVIYGEIEFWALDCSDLRIHYWLRWIEVEEELRKRYRLIQPPPSSRWKAEGTRILTYLVWPPREVGRPLYYRKKNRW